MHVSYLTVRRFFLVSLAVMVCGLGLAFLLYNENAMRLEKELIGDITRALRLQAEGKAENLLIWQQQREKIGNRFVNSEMVRLFAAEWNASPEKRSELGRALLEQKPYMEFTLEDMKQREGLHEISLLNRKLEVIAGKAVTPGDEALQTFEARLDEDTGTHSYVRLLENTPQLIILHPVLRHSDTIGKKPEATAVLVTVHPLVPEIFEAIKPQAGSELLGKVEVRTEIKAGERISLTEAGYQKPDPVEGGIQAEATVDGSIFQGRIYSRPSAIRECCVN